jgi:histone H3/H4
MANDVLVVQSKVKEFIKKKGCQTSATAIDALSKKVEQVLGEAIERAKSNNRATVKDRDI